MKLDKLREYVRDGRWAVPDAMRFNLDVAGLKELVADIDAEMLRAVARGRKEGGECREVDAAFERCTAPDTVLHDKSHPDYVVTRRQLAELHQAIESWVNERFALMNDRVKAIEAIEDSRRGTILHDIDATQVAFRQLMEHGFDRVSNVADRVSTLEAWRKECSTAGPRLETAASDCGPVRFTW